MAFQKAVKTKAKLRLALGGLAGSGKTFSALKIADEVAKLIRAAGHGDGRIAVLDSEHGSASLYADKFDFDVCELESVSPLAYVERIKEAEAEGYDIIIADSLSHAWSGKDGALAQKDAAAERDPRSNSWSAWRNVTPKHDALIDAILSSRSHVIATMRQKMEHIQQKNEQTGKTEIVKAGLGLVQRDQIDFEFTMVGEISLDHTLKITKTRCDIIDVGSLFEKPGEVFAKRLYGWLLSGAEPKPFHSEPPPAERRPVVAIAPPSTAIADGLDAVFAAYLAAIVGAPDLVALDKAVVAPGKPAKGTPESEQTKAAYLARKAQLQAAA